MKLLLTSGGLKNKILADFFISLLPDNLQNCSIAMLAYILDSEEEFYVNESKKELIDLGIKNISFFNLKGYKFDKDKDYDVIYVCGGNTFAILDRLRTLGLDEFIKDNILNKDVLYLGVSAGSIIAGPSIEVAGWGVEGDKNEVGLKNLTGLNFTNISIFPHYKPYLKHEVEEFKKMVEYPVVELTDEQAVFVDDLGYKLINK